MPVTAADLNTLASTLRLVTGNAGPVEPGDLVEAKVLSSLTEVTIVDTLAAIALTVPVQVDVRWTVVDHDGHELQVDSHFVANNGLTGPLVEFLFKPPIVELVGEPPPTFTWMIRATVTLRVGTVVSDAKQLAVPVEVVALELPVLLALFRHKQFAAFEDPDDPGFVLLVVPADSILKGLTEPFNDLMDRLDLALSRLRGLVGIAGFLTGLTILRHALASQPMVRTRAGNVGDLEDVHMRVETLLGFDFLNRDMRAADRVSSLVLMGPCGTRVGCYDDENFSLDDGEWAFNLRTGLEMITVIRDLHDGKPPPTFPPEDPNDDRSRRIFIRQMGGSSFGNNMSSVEFDPPMSDEERRLPDSCALPVTPEEPISPVIE
jgi:hypothetical protein